MYSPFTIAGRNTHSVSTRRHAVLSYNSFPEDRIIVVSSTLPSVPMRALTLTSPLKDPPGGGCTAWRMIPGLDWFQLSCCRISSEVCGDSDCSAYAVLKPTPSSAMSVIVKTNRFIDTPLNLPERYLIFLAGGMLK
jgi:hypothetical protein